MSSHPIQNFRRRRARALLALASAGFASAALAASASAAPATGEVVLSLKAGGERSLLSQGVRVSFDGKPGAATSAAGKAGKGKAAQTVKSPVTSLTIGDPAAVTTAGKLTLSLGKRKAVLSKVVFQVWGKSTTVSAKLGKRQLAVFRAQGAATIGSTAVSLDKASLKLTSTAAQALKGKLGLEALSSGRVGTLRLDAKLTTVPATPLVPIVNPPKSPQPDPYPYAAECPVPSVEGDPGFGTPPGTVDGIAAAPIFDSGVSQEVTGTAIDWGFLANFRNYVLNIDKVKAPGSLQPLDGATASAAGPGMAAPGAFFGFPVSTGTYEPGSEPNHADDKLVADSAGTVLFCKSGHGFNIVIKNPTVTIDGENSRITADVGANMNGTWYPFQRVDIATLDLTGAEPTISDGGNTIVWEDIPATMTADGATALGIYEEGDALDPITVSTSLNRPLLTACGIDAGIGTPPAVDFTLAGLPTLSDPVTGSGGTINWGFRRSTRNTVVGGAGTEGPFQLLGGASEGFPGNMGGSANEFPPAPNGGLGKFFRFPISSYEYEEGEVADPNDDRLIATSDATVGFCNVKFGSFGIAISKPTLVIDGGNSRIVANAYSYRAGLGWIGGRVDLVDLDTAAVDAVADSGNVSWGEVNEDNDPLENGIPVLLSAAAGLQTEAFSLASLTKDSTKTGGFDLVAAQIVVAD